MRKRCKRKIWALVNPIDHAINGASITPAKLLDQLLLRELASLDSMTRGVGTLSDWSDLVNVNNLTMTLASMKVGTEALPDAHKAETALIDTAKKYQATGKMSLSRTSLQALRDVIEWHHLQRANIPRSQYEEAIRLTEARIRSGHATIDLDKTLGKPGLVV